LPFEKWTFYDVYSVHMVFLKHSVQCSINQSSKILYQNSYEKCHFMSSVSSCTKSFSKFLYYFLCRLKKKLISIFIVYFSSDIKPDLFIKRKSKNFKVCCHLSISTHAAIIKYTDKWNDYLGKGITTILYMKTKLQEKQNLRVITL
jgi:hypothetical protein